VLKAFGGQLTIDEYRRGFVQFDGTICGPQDFIDMMLPPKRPRAGYVPPAFLDNSIVSIVRCTTEGGVLGRTAASGSFSTRSRSAAACSHAPIPTGPGPAPTSIKEKMEKSKRRRQAPVTRRGGSVTLDSSMGIKVKNRQQSS
jgi:hypothetical protein